MIPAPMIPVLLALPWQKHLEAACKEAAADLKKRARSMPAKKITKALVEDLLCKQAAKADKTLTKLGTDQLKGALKREEKKVEKEIEKAGDPSKPGPLKLLGLRGELEDYRVKGQIVEPDKPAKLSKPQGSAYYVPIKVKVLSKDKVELEIGGFLGIDKKIKEGKLKVIYGGVMLGGKF